MRLYLDNCCLNRPFDDQAQERVRLESEAIALILGRLVSHQWTWVVSAVSYYENARSPDAARSSRVEHLLNAAHVTAALGDADYRRAEVLARCGFGQIDAYHLACAEGSGCDVFLTTDDGIVRRSRRARLRVKVANPLDWLQEVMGNETA